MNTEHDIAEQIDLLMKVIRNLCEMYSLNKEVLIDDFSYIIQGKVK